MNWLERIAGVDEAYRESFDSRVAIGRDSAARNKVAFVSICRSAMPYVENTMRLVEQAASDWGECVWYIFENDSADGTADALDAFAASRPWVVVEHDTLGRDDLRGFEPERTVRLAEYRNRCQDWVRENAGDAGYVVVLDTDAHGGFAVDGVMNSLGWMCEHLGEVCRSREVGAMASHSLFVPEEWEEDGQLYTRVAAYDAWAARLNWFEDRRLHDWFHLLLPPVGSPPIPMNSAFGGLCLYRREAFLSGRYVGGDCEHVALHRDMQRAGYQLYLNPGSRYIAILP